MKLIFVVLALFVPSIAYASDPCADPGTTKLGAVINVGAATTTVIVPAPTNLRTYVCAWAMTLAGTTPTFKFIYGTKASTDCDTGAVNLSGVMAPTSGSFMTEGGSGTLFSTGQSQQVCGVTTGTGSSAQGVLTYVVQ